MKKKPSYIFIGEQHNDFSYVELVDKILQSCAEKGLKVALFPEFDDQVDKVAQCTNDEEKKNLPEGWERIAEYVSVSANNPAVKKIHGMDRRSELATSILAPRDKTHSFAEIVQEYPIGEVDYEVNVQPKLNELAKELKISEQELVNNVNYTETLLRSGLWLPVTMQSMAQDMSENIVENSGDEDVRVIWSGLWHTENLIRSLAVAPDQMVVVSNASRDSDDFLKTGKYLPTTELVPFSLNPKTNEPTIPQIIENELAEIQGSKKLPSPDSTMSFVEKLGLTRSEKPESFVERLQMRGGGNHKQ